MSQEKKRRFLIHFLCALGTLGLVFCSLGPFIGGFHWFLDLFAQFVVFYVGFAATFSLYFLITKRWLWAILAVAVLITNAAQVIPWYIPEASATREGPTVTILMANVHTSNTKYDRFIDLVRETDPDIVIAQENDQAWVDALDVLSEDYPHKLVRPRRDNFGMSLFSRIPLENLREEKFGDSVVPVICADVVIGDHAMSVISLHTLPPIGGTYSGIRDSQLGHVPVAVRNNPHPTLLIGDLNITPWSPVLKRMVREAGLKNARQGRGILTTWPTFYGPLKIPIDHCLYEDPLHVTEFEVLESVASDHLPILATVVLAPREGE